MGGVQPGIKSGDIVSTAAISLLVEEEHVNMVTSTVKHK